jgi:hypothetical protein
MNRRIQSKTALPGRRPTNLDAKTWKSIEAILNSSQQAQRATGRFKLHPYLVAVYRTYKEWRDLGVSKTMSRRVANAFKTARRKSTSPVRTLIDVTFSALDPKQKVDGRALGSQLSPKRNQNSFQIFSRTLELLAAPGGAAKQKPKKGNESR